MAIEFLPTQWKDGKTGNTPITAAQLNRIEKVADELVKTVNAETVKIENKVDKVKGKELSTNDFTNEDKQAVGKIAKKTDKTYVDNNFANAIKQVVSGDVISVSDVSPIKHIIGCKVSGTSNPTAVKVIRCNKNLAEKQPGTITIKTAETVLNFKKNVTFPKITISFDLKNFTSSNIGSAFWLIYKADGSPVEAKFIPAMKNFGIELNAAPVNKHISYSFENMIFSEIKMSYYGGLTGSIENLQIEIGEETPFIEINRTEYMAEPNGMVNGVQSIYPGMILYSDTAGITVNAEYSADTKSFIESNGGGALEPLTFTGAATGSYDGSVPVTIDIPTGGGEWVELINKTIELPSDVNIVEELIPAALQKNYNNYVISVSGLPSPHRLTIVNANNKQISAKIRVRNSLSGGKPYKCYILKTDELVFGFAPWYGKGVNAYFTNIDSDYTASGVNVIQATVADQNINNPGTGIKIEEIPKRTELIAFALRVYGR